MKSSGGITVEEVPEAYKERFIKAEQFMEYVNEKVRYKKLKALASSFLLKENKVFNYIFHRCMILLYKTI